MTVSERNVDAIFLGVPVMDLSAPFLRRSDLRGVCNGFIAALGLGAHAFVAGGGTFVASALWCMKVCCQCLRLPVTFKAQGFKSRGGGTFVASALLASPSVQDFNSCSVVFVSHGLRRRRARANSRSELFEITNLAVGSLSNYCKVSPS